MAKVWSFNTTVRNPERMQNFLRTLSELEGRIFDEKCQRDFFALQIKKKLYKPTPRTLKNPELIKQVYKKTAEEIPDKFVNRIVSLYKDKSKGDASMRGRTTAGILNRFGLCVAHKSKGKVVITDLGRKWLNNEVDDQDLFFRFLLKWQYPNPLEKGYSKYDIKPFIGILHLISLVNKKSREVGEKDKGISKIEFMLFGPSLINYKNIERYADEIISFRKKCKMVKGKKRKIYERTFIAKRVKKIFNNKSFKTAWSDLRDYTDSAIRYFRMSGFIYLRGNGRYVDISPDLKVETKSLLKTDNGKSMDFIGLNEYFKYLTDISVPGLPWENKDDLQKIKDELIKNIKEVALQLKKTEELEKFVFSISSFTLAKQVEKLKDIKNDFQIERLKSLKFNKVELLNFMDEIKNTLSDRAQTVTTRPSLDLEWFVSLSLMVLNDAMDIKPSYKIGDDGLPTGFSSNIADIECFYKKFGMIVEVTLLMGRDQWYAEGQPVMRHLRDFEDKNSSYNDDVYCLFIAPYLHRDTLNAFWNSVKGEGYEGKKQKIIPITIEQYLKILLVVKKALDKKIKVSHLMYENLLSSIHEKVDSSTHVHDWVAKIDSLIDRWQKQLYEN